MNKQLRIKEVLQYKTQEKKDITNSYNSNYNNTIIYTYCLCEIYNYR